MTTEQNMLIFSQQDIINLSQRTELPLQVVILTARRSATHMYFQDVRLFSTKINSALQLELKWNSTSVNFLIKVGLTLKPVASKANELEHLVKVSVVSLQGLISFIMIEL